ncbi:MAG TPA: FAD-linked oxidase C-terminal domain-containing protein [Gemmataceae bacterium]|nr:FAD-linked oxidase C-terminal domain-containing protein [Gemmataceae bacterium]
MPVVDAIGLQATLAENMTGEVRFDRLSRALYSTDASVYQIIPLGVVFPKSTADIVATVKTCARFGVPLTARGGGTSQAGQCIGPGVILDCSRHLNRVLEINAAERWVRVEPGCVLDELNRVLQPLGLHFPLDISTSDRATIGGMIANNSSGTHSLIYGKTIDHVLELSAVLADGSMIQLGALDDDKLEAKCRQNDREGECYRQVRQLAAEHVEEIERRYPRILRRVGGYNLDRFTPGQPFNLAPLFVGSEGTLGVTLEAKLHLAPLPRAKALLVIQFADLLAALAATPAILVHHPAAVEVIDKYVLDATRLNAEAARLRDFLAGDPGAILIVEFYADRAEDLPSRLDALEADLRSRQFGYHYHRAVESVAQARIWKLRRLSLGLSMAEKGDAKAISFVEDTAVAAEHLHDYIAEFLTILQRHGTKAGVYAHASVGCLHVRPVIDLKTESGVHQFEVIASEVAELVLKYGGALSGEHGDGLVRSPFQEKMYGSRLYQAFRTLKRAFDPANILNPGKIVDALPLTTSLRYGPRYVTPDVPTTFDFTADGGLVRAAELCAGVGECRKTRTGTMCPSYQATRDEQHSTRGRANALRLALTGQAELSGLTDPALHDALDLCLECKACKSECPTNVDMARLKAEFLHQYHQRHGVPWRSRLFGHVASVSRWGCRLTPLSNWLVRSSPVRWLNDKLLGIDSRRLPPPFAGRTFRQQFHARHRTAGRPADVLLFPDTFTNYHEPALGLAAVELLERAGCTVALDVPGGRDSAGLSCCGRPLISNGLLSEAVVHAEHNVARMYTWAADGKPIIACEPSCILTLKDDYPALLRGQYRRMAETVAAVCLTFEEFLQRWLPQSEKEDGSPRLSWRSQPRRILVQPHCHQRSLTGTASLLALLRRIPGATVVDLDAGCCGLAGSFGYEKEHYDASLQVAEHRLLPALRQAPADAVVIASGFSCRMQIAHCLGRAAVHPIEFLRVNLD